MSDPHVDRGPFRPGNYNLPRAVERINSLEPGPDFVVLAGDLINTAPSEVPEYYCEHTTEIDLLSHLLRDLVPPIHFVLGNHDYYKVILNRLVSDHKAMEEVWQKELGVGAPAAFDHQGFRFILLNSMQNYEDRLSEQDWWTGAFGGWCRAGPRSSSSTTTKVPSPMTAPSSISSTDSEIRSRGSLPDTSMSSPGARSTASPTTPRTRSSGAGGSSSWSSVNRIRNPSACSTKGTSGLRSSGRSDHESEPIHRQSRWIGSDSLMPKSSK